MMDAAAEAAPRMLKGGAVAQAQTMMSSMTSQSRGNQKQEVQRVRQNFPETWIWTTELTASNM